MKSRKRKHLISVSHVRAARARVAYDPDAPLVLTRRESMRLLDMIENPPPRTVKFMEMMALHRQSKISYTIDTLLQNTLVEQCADTGLFVGKIAGIPGAHSQGATPDELRANLREVLTMLIEGATAKEARLFATLVEDVELKRHADNRINDGSIPVRVRLEDF